MEILTDVASDPTYDFYRVLDEYGEYADRNLIKSIVWAVDNDTDVINLSVGSDHISNSDKDCGPHGAECAVDEAAEYASEKGTILVSAAGNEPNAENVCCPALSENSIAVGGCVAKCTATPQNKNSRTGLKSPNTARPPGSIWVKRSDGEGVEGTFCSMNGCSPTHQCEDNRSVEPWNGNPRFFSDTPDTLAPAYYPRMLNSGIIMGQGSSFATPIVSATLVNIIEGLRANGENISPSKVRELIRVSGSPLESVPVGVFDGEALVSEIFEEKGLGPVNVERESGFDTSSPT